MKKYFLVEFNRDWGDEFNIYGLKAMDEESVNKFKQSLEENRGKLVCLYFGTNEGWEGEKVWEFISSYKFHEVSKSTFDEFKNKFGFSFGNFYDVNDYLEDE